MGAREPDLATAARAAQAVQPPGGQQAAAPADASAVFALPQAWARWVENLMLTNRMPLSGNVDQWIRTWGEAVGQVGLVNYNIAGAGNPELEKRIGARYSYGRQLGRMLDVLEPLVEASADEIAQRARPGALAEFRQMVSEIRAMKCRSPAEIADEVRAWQGRDDFEQRLAELLRRLETLAGAPS